MKVSVIEKVPHARFFIRVVALDQTFNGLTNHVKMNVFCCASVNPELIGEWLERQVHCCNVGHRTSASRKGCSPHTAVTD